MRVVFVIHNHQPIGNDDTIFDAATTSAYLPLLETLDASPDSTRIVVHNSGPLWEWWQEHRPDVVEGFTTSDRIEFLGGGWYEPVLAAIPENDRVEQLKLTNDRLEALVEMRPAGAWLGERFWQPDLAGTLNRHDIHYTLLDSENLPFGYPATRPYTLDYHGRTVSAFFILQQLRRAIPDDPVDDVIAALELLAARDPDGVVVIADDGEKLGFWDNRYTPEWLAQFFVAVDAHPDLEFSTLNEAHAAVPSGGHLPLGPCSYSEMMEWSGGHWPRLVSSSQASMVLYRRMIRLSRSLRRASDEARRHLLRGQCNDAYWHGAFGGSRLPILRHAVTRELILARVAYDKRRGAPSVEVEVIDWNADGHRDVHVELPQQSWVAASVGAGLFYWDDKASVWGLTDVDWPTDPVLGLSDRWDTGFVPAYEMTEPASGRSDATVTYTSPESQKSISGSDRQLIVRYELGGAPASQFGPVLPLAVDRRSTIRVDGGTPAVLGAQPEYHGHRFRIITGDEQHQILVYLPVPGRLEQRPLITEHVDERGATVETYQGVVLWLSYPTTGSGTYEFHLEVMD